LAVALLSLFGASVGVAATAGPTVVLADDTVIKPFGWKGRESIFRVEDKNAFAVAAAIGDLPCDRVASIDALE
jgi:hypothetical protein